MARLGQIQFNLKPQIIEYEVYDEMWKYNEHEHAVERQAFGTNEAYEMVAASSEKDHYLAFKGEKVGKIHL